MSAPVPAVRGVIHDLGYKRYAGGRRPQSTRWRVILRNQMAFAWKTWWRYKAWIGFSVLITVVIAAGMYAAQTEELRGITRNGMIARQIDKLSLGSIEYFTAVGFLVTLTCGAGIVANDLRSGAFTFYFSRPVRPMDYLLGKLSGLFTLHFLVIGLPMLVLMGVRLGLSQDTDELLVNLEHVPKILLIGALAALVFSSMSLGFSSLFTKPALSIGMWAVYYIIGYLFIVGISVGSKVPWIGALDFGHALKMLAFRMFDFGSEEKEVQQIIPSMSACLIGLALNISAGIGLAYWRIRAAAHAGIGGG